MTRVRLTGIVPVALAPAEAFRLFTPSGERAWAHGWDPIFPDGDEGDTAPGAVFLTRHGDAATTWVVVACDPGRSVAYARIAQDRAGIVTVECEPDGAGATNARVTYDLTALVPGDDLGAFAARYEAFLEGWREAISVSVAAA